MLDRQPPPAALDGDITPERAAGLAALLDSWINEGDPDEQAETFNALVEGLNETRRLNGERLHFPPEMKGRTW